MSLIRQKGFTLIETLFALTLASTILLPASLWLYHSRASRAALAKFRATQVLEMEMNRAVILHLDHDSASENPGRDALRIRIHCVREGREIRLLGSVADRQGRPLAALQSAWFAGEP